MGKRLWFVLILVAGYCILEVVGGFWSGSLALLADAGHMVSDVTSLIVSLLAFQLATRRPLGHQTFGLHRAEILGALINGSLLFVVAGGILLEAWERLASPSPILAGPMLAIACGGLIVNLISLGILHGDRNHNLNLRGAWLHVMGDALGSVAVIVAAVLVWTLGWTWADPVASILACLLIFVSAWRLLSDALRVLMEHAPREINVDLVRQRMLEIPGVNDVHCLHVWTIASGLSALSAHVVLMSGHPHDAVLIDLQQALRASFPLQHLTLQLEASDSTICPERGDGECLIL